MRATPDQKGKVLVRTAALVPERLIQLRDGKRDHCILASRVGRDVLGYFGIEAYAVPTATTIVNGRFVEMIEAGFSPEQCREDPLAYAVGAGPVERAPQHLRQRAETSRGFNGHVVLHVPEAKVLVDLSLGQFSRPERDMPTSEQLILRGVETFEPDEKAAAYNEETGVVVTYERIATNAWKRAPDWREDPEEIRRVTGSVIREIRDELAI